MRNFQRFKKDRSNNLFASETITLKEAYNKFKRKNPLDSKEDADGLISTNDIYRFVESYSAKMGSHESDIAADFQDFIFENMLPQKRKELENDFEESGEDDLWAYYIEEYCNHSAIGYSTLISSYIIYNFLIDTYGENCEITKEQENALSGFDAKLDDWVNMDKPIHEYIQYVVSLKKNEGYFRIYSSEQENLRPRAGG